MSVFSSVRAQLVPIHREGYPFIGGLALVSAGGDWRPPFYVRSSLGDWSFPAATDRITQATALLGREPGTPFRDGAPFGPPMGPPCP